ncbi:hypothetical protein [Arthrobacter sp. H20]|uniref:hypothetical protein n=1 Tax=Arthrobacter sp. H20 TaxID=1267981 RepID=UPI00047D3F84|nr:hypothetical protein [Arthrobacter sp. H20]
MRCFPARPSTDEQESGSAVLEFIFLGLVLLVPVIYFVLTIGQLQAGSFAVVGAADQAAKVYVAEASAPEATALAHQAAALVLGDFGFESSDAEIDIRCNGECLAPGSSVTVDVRLGISLPFVPSARGMHDSAATVSSTATQLVERFR